MPSHILRRFTSALALVSLLAGTCGLPVALAAPDTSTISGRVLDQDGITPLKDVVVKLKSRSSESVFSSQPSDADGGYKIPDVPDGEYSIGVATVGEEFDLPNRVTIIGGQPSAITVIVTTAASKAARSGGQAPPARSRKATVLIPVFGSILVAAFAANEIFEGDEDDDGSPKLP